MRNLFFFLFLLMSFSAKAEEKGHSYFFSFDGREKKAVPVHLSDVYTSEKGYGYDLTEYAKPEEGKPFFFSIKLPRGNYKVTITFGDKKAIGCTTVKAEQRRLFLENINTRKGEFRSESFVINKRDGFVSEDNPAHVEVRANTLGLDWDEKLTFEFNGEHPAVSSLSLQPADELVPTIWLCGNSTVVDQDFEPWASWGQMITRWFDDNVSVANYAESGWRMSTLMGSKRLQQMMLGMKDGDYLFVEFGHNDQKEKGPGKGAYYNFATLLKTLADMAREKGVTPIFVTPTQRRNFDAEGKIIETHGDYPDAMRWVAKRENIKIIELHDMTRTFFETLGVENSKKALVHYPANTFPNQEKDLADNTHFNDYGAYEISKMMIEGMKQLQLPFISHIRKEYEPYSPASPDDFNTFSLSLTPIYGMEKPAGN